MYPYFVTVSGREWGGEVHDDAKRACIPIFNLSLIAHIFASAPSFSLLYMLTAVFRLWCGLLDKKCLLLNCWIPFIVRPKLQHPLEKLATYVVQPRAFAPVVEQIWLHGMYRGARRQPSSKDNHALPCPHKEIARTAQHITAQQDNPTIIQPPRQSPYIIFVYGVQHTVYAHILDTDFFDGFAM